MKMHFYNFNHLAKENKPLTIRCSNKTIFKITAPNSVFFWRRNCSLPTKEAGIDF